MPEALFIEGAEHTRSPAPQKPSRSSRRAADARCSPFAPAGTQRDDRRIPGRGLRFTEDQLRLRSRVELGDAGGLVPGVARQVFVDDAEALRMLVDAEHDERFPAHRDVALDPG